MFHWVTRKAALRGGGVAAVICLAVNLYAGRELLYSASMALGVMFAVSVIFVLTINCIGKVLLAYLQEQRLKEAQEVAEAANSNERRSSRIS